MEPLDALDRAVREFGRRVAEVGDDRWDAPSPCEGWSARDVVEHGIAGNRMSVLLLAGATAADAIAAVRAAPVGDDPVAAYDEAGRDMVDAFRAPGALSRTVHHPRGDITGEQFLGFRVGDLVIHAWDLARAIGADDRLDPALVEVVWRFMSPMAPFIGTIGIFGEGPSGTVADDADLQDRLLDLAGRRP
ncbi:MAG TPA: TIGR03086 family metal-binding protein [Acidimicrobiales bacterium]|jgi:uncharacterized protein (TIGR03086 family)